MNTTKDVKVIAHPLDEEVEVRTRTGYWGYQCPRTVKMTGAQLAAAVKVAANEAGVTYGD